jgi:hypothetical protein
MAFSGLAIMPFACAGKQVVSSKLDSDLAKRVGTISSTRQF